jgi:hypothetical protein
MEKESYPLRGFDAEKPSQEEPSDFDLYDEPEHDKYLKAVLDDSDPETEKSETEKMPEATEDQSY